MGDPFQIEPTLTRSFRFIEGELAASSVQPVDASAKKPRVVVMGGGKGASLSIRTLLTLDVKVDAVVAMADDGGSTGIIRNEAHVSPPGDVRKCLCAMAADQDAPFTHAFRYRFEFARNHTLGNLMLSALEHETGSFPEAVRICEKLLNARGHVYPSTLDNVNLSALDVDGNVFDGQAVASHSSRPLRRVWLVAPEGCRPYSKALAAIRQADFIVLGPGSLFTSVIPNLLVPGVIEALQESNATCIFVCNVTDADGETKGMAAEQHVQALMKHGMEGLLDYVIVHATGPLRPRAEVMAELAGMEPGTVRPVPISLEGAGWIADTGAHVMVRRLSSREKPEWHDPRALRAAFREVFAQCLSQRM